MKTKFMAIIIFLTLCITLSGCGVADKINVKLGIKNSDFEYMRQKKVDKIVIQSTRDIGFRFIVNDQKNIKDIYNVLSSGKSTNEKTTLDSDYIFEIHTGSEVKKFNYVARFEEGKQGNFYDEENIYVMSKKLDNDIIQNLSFIRKPREFQNVYYPSILKAMEENKQLLNIKDLKVGIDILGDTECTKYLLSVEIDDFLRKAKEIVPAAELMNHNRENFDIIISVNNYGYKTKTYKSIITIENKKENSQKKLYVDCTYDNAWVITLEDKFPLGWK